MLKRLNKCWDSGSDGIGGSDISICLLDKLFAVNEDVLFKLCKSLLLLESEVFNSWISSSLIFDDERDNDGRLISAFDDDIEADLLSDADEELDLEDFSFVLLLDEDDVLKDGPLIFFNMCFTLFGHFLLK